MVAVDETDLGIDTVERTNVCAIVALLCALTGLFIPALVFGAIGYVETGGREDETGSGLAVAAMILGAIELTAVVVCAARHYVQVDRVAPLPADIHRWRGLRLAVPQHNAHRPWLPPMSPGPRPPADSVSHETVAAARDRGPPIRHSTDKPTPIARRCQGTTSLGNPIRPGPATNSPVALLD